LLQDDWQTIRQGLEVKMCQSPEDGRETYILCRSQDRKAKEKAMHERFEQRIDAALDAALAHQSGSIPVQVIFCFPWANCVRILDS